MLQWTWGHRYPFGIVISFPSNIYKEVGSLSVLILEESSREQLYILSSALWADPSHRHNYMKTWFSLGLQRGWAEQARVGSPRRPQDQTTVPCFHFYVRRTFHLKKALLLHKKGRRHEWDMWVSRCGLQTRRSKVWKFIGKANKFMGSGLTPEPLSWCSGFWRPRTCTNHWIRLFDPLFPLQGSEQEFLDPGWQYTRICERIVFHYYYFFISLHNCGLHKHLQTGLSFP